MKCTPFPFLLFCLHPPPKIYLGCHEEEMSYFTQVVSFSLLFFYVRGGAFELWKPIPSWVPFLCERAVGGNTLYGQSTSLRSKKVFFRPESMNTCLKTPTRLTSLLLISKIGRLNEVSPFPSFFPREYWSSSLFKRGGFKAPFLSFVWIRACTKFLMRAQWASRV